MKISYDLCFIAIGVANYILKKNTNSEFEITHKYFFP